MALKTAAVLAFERKLSNSDGIMKAGNWDDRNKPSAWQPISLTTKDVKGTISNRMGSKTDPAKLDAAIQNANLQSVDVAALPFHTDTLQVGFSLRILGNLDVPSGCNDSEYQAAIAAVINGYADEHGFTELAKRYATNIASGRFLWRNRVGVDAVEVHVTQIKGRVVVNQFVFQSEDFDLRNFDKTTPDLEKLAAIIRQGIADGSAPYLQVSAFARIGGGQEVFPSQELVLGKGDKQGKSKLLYQVGGVAAMHSQKIGNALRCIDDWFPEAKELGPIAVEPYGSVTNRGRAYRQPKEGMDFYTLLDNWVVRGKAPDVSQQHYVIATLLRGGVFGEKAE